MVKGKLITIEGGEGAGKSTALAFIKRYFLLRLTYKFTSQKTKEEGDEDEW